MNYRREFIKLLLRRVYVSSPVMLLFPILIGWISVSLVYWTKGLWLEEASIGRISFCLIVGLGAGVGAGRFVGYLTKVSISTNSCLCYLSPTELLKSWWMSADDVDLYLVYSELNQRSPEDIKEIQGLLLKPRSSRFEVLYYYSSRLAPEVFHRYETPLHYRLDEVSSTYRDLLEARILLLKRPSKRRI